MTVDVKRLRELAEALIPNETRGNWYARETYVYQSNDPLDRRQVCRVPTVSRPHEVDPTAAYIAAASPTTVLALLDENEMLRCDRDSFANSDFERQLDDARQQLAAMTAARNSACDEAQGMAELLMELGDEHEEGAQEALIDIADLRKVGTP